MLYKYLWQDKQVDGRRLASRATVRPQADDSTNFDTLVQRCFCPWANVLFLVSCNCLEKKKHLDCNSIGKNHHLLLFSLMVLASTILISTRISHEAAAQLWVVESPWTFFTHLAGGSCQLDNLQVGFTWLRVLHSRVTEYQNKCSERQLGRRCNSFNASGVPEYHFYCEVDTMICWTVLSQRHA